MEESYRAVLKGDRLEWVDEGPSVDESGVEVQVTLLPEDSQVAQRGRLMATALDQLSVSGAFGDVRDPVRWQRGQRAERVLPGRD